jgi:hypothetical protein
MLVAGFFRLLEEIPEPIWRFPLSYVSYHTYALRVRITNPSSLELGYITPDIASIHRLENCTWIKLQSRLFMTA